MLAACSDDSGQATCLREGDARVCAEREDGAVALSGVGLQRGSDLEVATEEIGAERFTVGANGEPDGAIGFVGTTSSPLEVQVEATIATGATLAGTLVIE